MKRTGRPLGLLLALVFVVLAVAPAAQATIFERMRFTGEPYAFEDEICGIEVQIEGTVSGSVTFRTGKGKFDTAFFQHSNLEYSETWTAAGGGFVTVTGRSNFNEVKAVPLGGNLFRFTAVEAGQPFRLFDSQGNLVLRDRGAIRFSAVFDTLGDEVPGAVLVEEFEPSVRGPHPGFFDETLCPALVPLLTGS
jgi:hypothetical protein